MRPTPAILLAMLPIAVALPLASADCGLVDCVDATGALAVALFDESTELAFDAERFAATRALPAYEFALGLDDSIGNAYQRASGAALGVPRCATSTPLGALAACATLALDAAEPFAVPAHGAGFAQDRADAIAPDSQAALGFAEEAGARLGEPVAAWSGVVLP